MTRTPALLSAAALLLSVALSAGLAAPAQAEYRCLKVLTLDGNYVCCPTDSGVVCTKVPSRIPERKLQ